jgi:trehalose synthase
MDSENQSASAHGTSSPSQPSGEIQERSTSPGMRFPERRLADRRNGRSVPASLLTPPTPPPPPHLDDYASIVGRAQIESLRFLADQLKGKSIKMVNSTALGGGVAEMLNRLIPLLSELQVPTHWDVITGGNDFFEVTKAFHNALHGKAYELTQAAKHIFLMYTEQNRQRMHFEEEMVVIHDPQPLGLVLSRDKTPASWVWRCHIDLSNPDRRVWEFLRPFVEHYDAAIFSSQSFARQLSIPQYLFYPCIDPLSEKNRELSDAEIQQVCDAKKYVDCQLVLAGGGANDDPEGAAVLQETRDAAGDDPDVVILDLPPWCALQINAIQRASTIIVQKSLKEGFGLTVTEALWKGKPTIAGAVGGIPNQIIHNLTGVLVHSVEGCAFQIRYLLTHPEFARTIGANGREHVKENFLMSSNVKRWLLLFRILEQAKARLPKAA